MHNFHFFLEDNDGQYQFCLGSWDFIAITDSLEEIHVSADSINVDIIIGYAYTGKFICLPTLGAGFGLPEKANTSYIEHILNQQLGSD